jgi:mono/diheme cytochrome c family protein
MQHENNRCKILRQPKSAAIFAVVLIAFYLLIASGCTKKEGKVGNNSDVVVNSFAMREGERLYNKYCTPCHGTEGQGDGIYFTTNLQPSPPDFTDEQLMNSRTDKQLFDAISESPAGAENKGVCPPWGGTFAKEEIDILITYIRKKFTEVSP